MKFITYSTLFVLFVLTQSCNSAAANNMADEMCMAMEKYDKDAPMSMYDAASDMNRIKKDVDKYGTVSNAQLKKAMLKKCPEGWAKYETLKDK